jgi:3-deoxy-D-manno-octulosonic-acid transferase
MGNSKTVVAGSTWPKDENVLQKAFALLNNPLLKLIIAPHEIHEKHLDAIKTLFPNSIRFSEISDLNKKSEIVNVLIIDNIGMLSKLYKYGHINYVGGGFRTMGVHNVLEAAVYGKPVIIGPFYKKYAEAIGLVDAGGGLVAKDEKELAELLMSDESRVIKTGKAASEFVFNNAGATGKIIQYIQEKRLLTN